LATSAGISHRFFCGATGVHRTSTEYSKSLTIKDLRKNVMLVGKHRKDHDRVDISLFMEIVYELFARLDFLDKLRAKTG
jgi:hypothetical protein